MVITASDCIFFPPISATFFSLQVFKAGERRNIKTCNLRSARSAPRTVRPLLSHTRAERTNSYLWFWSDRASPGSRGASWHPRGLACWQRSIWWFPSSPGRWWSCAAPAWPRRSDPCRHSPPRISGPGCQCSNVSRGAWSCPGLLHPTRWTSHSYRWRSPR